MIKNILISDYKCLHSEDLEFKPLTIITGLNSTGKSSLIQSILLPLYLNKDPHAYLLKDLVNSRFDTIRNRYRNSKELKITIQDESEIINVEGAVDRNINLDRNFSRELERNLYYLSANRIGAQQNVKIDSDIKVGVYGENIFATFEDEKSNSLRPSLVKDNTSFTLSTQLNHWLTYITGIKTELSTEKRLDEFVEIKFKSDDINNISPFQLGAGISYLAKIIIMCLRAEEEDIIIIENPEIHLHPAAQSRLGEFFAFITNSNIQLIIETHCEHLIYRIGYQIYKGELNNNNVNIFYKSGIQEPFTKIEFKSNGLFNQEFPEGFFDVNLYELFEMEE